MITRFRKISRAALVLGLAFSAVSAGAVATAHPSAAATDGSYQSSARPKDIVSVRFYQSSAEFTIPTTAPSTATITTVDASWNYINRPYYDLVYVWLCIDAANTQCAPVKGPYGNQVSGATVTGITAFVNKPISTKFHWLTYVDDGQTGSIHAARNPALYAQTPSTQPPSNYAKINYTY